MFAIIGIVVVFGAVVAGYLMEHGHLAVLVQPAELLIIGGAGGGTLLIANPLRILKKIAGGAAGVFGSSHFGKERYLSTLRMMYDLSLIHISFFNRAAASSRQFSDDVVHVSRH